MRPLKHSHKVNVHAAITRAFGQTNQNKAKLHLISPLTSSKSYNCKTLIAKMEINGDYRYNDRENPVSETSLL